MLQQTFDLLNLSKPINNIPSVIIAEHDWRVCCLKVVRGLCLVTPGTDTSLSWAVTQELSKLAFTLKDLEQASYIFMCLRLYSFKLSINNLGTLTCDCRFERDCLFYLYRW